jgi:hypothetical protein
MDIDTFGVPTKEAEMSANRRWPLYVPIAAAAAAIMLAMTGQPAAADVHRTYSYEYGLSGWEVGYDGNGSWEMARTTERSYDGQYGIECYLDGADGGGTAWLAHSYRVPFDTLVSATITFNLWSPEQSDFNPFAVVAYVGTERPTSAADFEYLGSTNQVAGWQQYRFEALQLTGQWPATIWVAFGIASTWEFQREYAMDYVRVTLTP